MQAGDLERGKYFVHNGKIVKVVRKETVSVGTHSHSKLKLYIENLFGKGNKQLILEHSAKVDGADIIKKTGQIISKLGDKVQVMDSQSYETFDAELAENVEVNEGEEVIFIDNQGQMIVLEKKR